MGSCYSKSPTVPTTRKQTSRRTTHQQSSSSASAAGGGGGSSNGSRWTRTRSSKREESAIHEQALAAAVLLHQQLQTGGNTTAIFNRSTSLRNQNSHGSGSTKKNPPLPRSSSSRARSLTDPLLQPHQLVNQTKRTRHSSVLKGNGYITSITGNNGSDNNGTSIMEGDKNIRSQCITFATTVLYYKISRELKDIRGSLM